jgi:hypothetical protein
MKESEFIKLNFRFEISNFYANVKVKITSFRTAVRQLANTLTVREFSKWIIVIIVIAILPGELYYIWVIAFCLSIHSLN